MDFKKLHSCYLWQDLHLAPHPKWRIDEGMTGREGRPVRMKTRKETMEMRGRCPLGWGHWSRRSSGKGRRVRWGRGGCWKSLDLEGGEGRELQPITVT